MPIYKVQAPDGKIYTVEGPEGATQNQVFQFVQSQIQSQPQQPDYSKMSTEELEKAPSAPTSISDIGRSLGMGLMGGAKTLTDVFGAGNQASTYLGRQLQETQANLTPARQAEMARQQELEKRAAESGEWGREAKTFLSGVASAPVQSVAQAVGTSVPTIITGIATALAAPEGALGIGVARIAQIAMGAAQGVGEYKGDVHDAVKQAYKEKGYDDERAEQLAVKAQEYSINNVLSVGGAGLLGALDAFTGIESSTRKAIEKAGKGKMTQEAIEAGIKALPEKPVAAPSLTKAALSSMAGEAPLEGLQGGFGQYAQNLALQREGLLEGDTTQGVLGSALRDAAVGALTGGVFTPVKLGEMRSDYNLDQSLRQQKEQQDFDKQLAAQIEEAQNKPAVAETFDLPGGYKVTAEEIGRTEAPTEHHIMEEGGAAPLATVASEEEIAPKIERLNEIRKQEAAKYLEQIDKINEDLNKKTQAVETMEALGQANTPEYLAAKQNLEQSKDVAAQQIKDLMDKTEALNTKLVHQPGAPVTQVQQQFVLSKDGQSIGTFKSVQDAENHVRSEMGPEAFTQALEQQNQAEQQAQHQKNIDELKTRLEPMLAKFGLKDVGLNIVEQLRHGAEGSYASKLINVALNAQKPVQVMRHEVIHALKDLGFFTPQQWSVLQNMANKKWIAEYLEGQNAEHEGEVMSRLDAYKKMKLSQDEIIEEAIADAFGAFNKNKPPAGMLASLHKKLVDFFEALKNAFHGAGFQTAESVFEHIEQGKLKPSAAPTSEEKLSLAPEGIPQKIWNLHEKVRQADEESTGRVASGKAPGALKRNQTMSFRRLNKAVMDFVGGDDQKALDLMVQMNRESGRRDSIREKEEEEKYFQEKLSLAPAANKEPKIVFEVAPDPDNKELSDKWNAIDESSRLNISNRIAEQIVDDAFEATNSRGTIEKQIGSYLNNTNPSFAISLKEGNPLEFAKFLGHALSQKSMVVLSSDEGEGLSKTGAIIVSVGNKSAKEIDEIYQKLRRIHLYGEQSIGGQSTINGEMIILNYSKADTSMLAKEIDYRLGREYNVEYTDIYAAFPEKEDYNYASFENVGSKEEANIRSRSNSLRAKASELLQKEIDSYRPPEPAERPSIRGGIVLGKNKQEGATSYRGVHYGKNQVSVLTGRSWSTGIKGAERERLEASNDPRLKKRIYFYIPKENGEMPLPEAGVGHHVYEQTFANILGPTPELNRIASAASKEGKSFESAVIDAGYDGYAVPSMGMMVILNHDAPVKYLGTRAELAERGIKYSLAGAGVERSTRDLMERSSEWSRAELGLKNQRVKGATGMNNVRDVAKALNQHTLDQFGRIGKGEMTAYDIDDLAKAVTDEVGYQLRATAKTGTGQGWYSKNYPNALKKLGDRFPELKENRHARSVFSALVAVTSNGEDVSTNIKNAIRLYSDLRQGKPLVPIGVRRGDALTNNLVQIQNLLDKHKENFAKVLTEEITVADMNAYLRSIGEKPDASYLANTRIPAAAIYFGPKLGAFFANLSGSEGYLTMDLWWTRSINRMRGLLMPQATESSINKFRDLMGRPSATREEVIAATVPFKQKYEDHNYVTELEFLAKGKEPNKDKYPQWLAKAKRNAGPAFQQLMLEHRLEKMANTIYKNEYEMLKEAPFNPSDRKFMYEVARKAQRNLSAEGIDLSLADIQAALWYYEKRLYAKLTGREADDIGYEEAIIKQSSEGHGREGPSVVFSEQPNGRNEPTRKGGISDETGGVTPEKLSLRAPQTPEFKRWFGDSKIVNEDGTPKVMYHGLAKDTTDFTRKTARGAPIFLTDDPKFAEKFATDSFDAVAKQPEKYLSKEQINDGAKKAIAAIRKDYGKDTLGKEMIESINAGNPTEEAKEYLQKEYVNMLPAGPHIMPLYVRAENPFDYENSKHLESVGRFMAEDRGEFWSKAEKDKFAKDMAQYLSDGNWEEIERQDVQNAIKVLGFDSFYVKEHGRKNLAVYEPNQVKSATGNTGEYSRVNNDVRYSLGRVSFPTAEESEEAVKQSKVPDTPEFKRFINQSQFMEDGKPKPMYHGTSREFYEFTGNAIHITDNAKDAEKFAQLDEDRTRQMAYKALTKDEKVDFFQRVVDKALDDGDITEAQASDVMRKVNRKAPDYGSFFENVLGDRVANELADLSPAKLHVMPLYVSGLNIFDFENPQHVDGLMQRLARTADLGKMQHPDQWLNGKKGQIRQGLWQAIENEQVQRAMKSSGFDGYSIRLKGKKSYAVYKSTQLKSITGNFGDFSNEVQDIRYSLPKMSDEFNQRLNETTTAREQKGWVERMLGIFSPSSYNSFRQSFVNRYEELARADKEFAKKMGQTQIAAEASAEHAALSSDMSAGVTAAAFGIGGKKGGVPIIKNGFTGIDRTKKGLLEIFQPLAKYDDPKAYRYFQFYSAVKRGARLYQEGRERLIQPGDVKFANELAQKFPEFEQIRKDWVEYNEALIKYQKDAGVLSERDAHEYTKHYDYIPFYRQLDGESTIGPSVYQSISGVKKPKKLEGGKAPLADFLETVVRNSQAAITAGMKNIAAQKAVEVGKGAGVVHEIQPGSTVKDYEKIKVLEKGVLKEYQSDDPLFVDAVKSLHMTDIPFLGMLSAPSRLLREAVTRDPGFIFANLIRDSLSAYATSGENITPVIDTINNFGKALGGNSPAYQALVDAGIIGGYEFSKNIEQSASTVAKELSKRAGNKGPTLLRPFKSLWDGLEHATTASDAATRMAIYDRVMQETGNEQEALRAAWEVMNFNRKGNSPIVRILTAAVPFLNARIQGLDVFYRAATGKMNSRDAKTVQRRFIARAAMMFGLSLLYAAAVSGDPDYENQEDETKDNNWIVPSLGIKIPIPFEVGTLFKTIPERIYRVTLGNDTGQDFMSAMKRAANSTLPIAPTAYIPQVIKPLLEATMNYNIFTDREIVSQGMKDLATEYQIGPNTSKLAEFVGKTLGLSPLKVDHVLKGYTGTMGMYAVDLIDSIMDLNGDSPKASKRFEQMPVIKRFALDPEARGSITNYYKLKDSVDTAVRTMNMLDKTMQPEEFQKYMQDNIGLLAFKDYIGDLEKTMKQFRDMKKTIQSSPMSGDEKRDALSAISKAEINLTSNIQFVKKTISELQ
jgi:Large polyvalent protein associated domain 38/ADP-Ribosyltransferase in polyvalent proteins